MRTHAQGRIIALISVKILWKGKAGSAPVTLHAVMGEGDVAGIHEVLHQDLSWHSKSVKTFIEQRRTDLHFDYICAIKRMRAL